MPAPPDERIARIADAIERYFSGHPKAADTFEGIADWWLADQRRRPTPAEIQQALDYLAEKGVISKTKLLDGRVVYATTEPPLR